MSKYQYMYIEEKYRHIFINNRTGQVYIKIRHETWIRHLYNTLKDISNNSDLFYSDKRYTSMLKKEVNEYEGILKLKDFSIIKPLISSPLTVYYKFNNEKIKLETTNLPGGGVSVAFVLGILESFMENYKKKNESLLDFVIIEALKYAFSLRTNFGDPRFNNMDNIIKTLLDKKFQKTILRKIMLSDKTHDNNSYYFQRFAFLHDSGTANIVVKTNSEILVLTSTINLRFGSWIISKSGIVFNNQMSDFSLPNRQDAGHLPPAKYNFPEPGKYPISSISTSS